MELQVECVLFNSNTAHFLFAIVIRDLAFKTLPVLPILKMTQRKNELLIAVNEPLKPA